jgi:hypothetical protein
MPQCTANVAIGSKAELPASAFHLIVLQKSKVASVRIFGETLKRRAIDDSHTLSRVTEVAYEREVMRSIRFLHENRTCGL